MSFFQDEGILSSEEAASIRSSHRATLDDAMASLDLWKPQASMLGAQWSKCVWPASKESQRDPETGVNIETLKKVGHASVDTPAGFVSKTRTVRRLCLNSSTGNPSTPAKACQAAHQGH
jgi:probable 2-oxoglutarate dehydrogenase E1 component DHKTD1